MFVFGLDGGCVAEIHFYCLAHYSFAIENLPNPNCCSFIQEGYYYPSEALEGGP